NIKCRESGLAPDAGVLVATVRGLKAHSGHYRIVAGKPLPEDLLKENPDEVHMGGSNLVKQIQNLAIHGVTPVVAINRFPDDHDADLDAIAEIASAEGVRAVVTTHVAEGGKGAADLAAAVAEAAEEPSRYAPLYPLDMPLREKIATVATRVYGAGGVEYTKKAARQIDGYEKQGFGDLPVCIAKTHLSLSSDPSLKGAPTGWTLEVREARISAGAGFVYPICGSISTMPGLGRRPAAAGMDIDENGEIIGLS
ncbi:MAG TPA: formate--tetrahydrofolate ligase, partial [Acidimicrobiales bacterium]|nr:formate--tetrahydrofolate ligase [Acidimicrobiales bacterium]